MRSIIEIKDAVDDSQPGLSQKELRLCIQSMSAIDYFCQSRLTELIELIRSGTSEKELLAAADRSWNTVENMHAALEKTPEEFLGEQRNANPTT